MQNCGPTGVLLKEICLRHQITGSRPRIHHIRWTMLFDTFSGFVRIDLMKYYGMELKNVLEHFKPQIMKKIRTLSLGPKIRRSYIKKRV